jgi:hypothetical protein
LTVDERMTREQLVQHLVSAADDGTLLTAKHDPANLCNPYSSHRSVLSFELAGNLEYFVKSGSYDLLLYDNAKYPTSPFYLEIIPASGSTFTVPGSGVAPHATVPHAACDRLIAVSGHNQGIHLHATNHSEIQTRVANGDLLLKYTYLAAPTSLGDQI